VFLALEKQAPKHDLKINKAKDTNGDCDQKLSKENDKKYKVVLKAFSLALNLKNIEYRMT
jgi:hypothetical protein